MPLQDASPLDGHEAVQRLRWTLPRDQHSHTQEAEEHHWRERQEHRLQRSQAQGMPWSPLGQSRHQQGQELQEGLRSCSTWSTSVDP